MRSRATAARIRNSPRHAGVSIAFTLAALAATTAPAAPPPLSLRAVLQIGHDSPPLVAAWHSQPGYLISAGASDVILWDANTGHVVNRQLLPPPLLQMPPPGAVAPAPTASLLTRLQPLGFAANGRQLLVSVAFDLGLQKDKVYCATYDIDPVANGEPTPPLALPAPSEGCPPPPALSRRDAAGRSWQINGDDITIMPGAGGGQTLRLTSQRERFDSGSVSPDAQFVAQVAVTGTGDTVETRIAARSLRSGTVFRQIRVPGAYGRVQWLDEGRMLLIPWPEPLDFCSAKVSETLVVVAATGAIVDRMPTLRQLNPLGTDGTMVGTGPALALGNCPPPGETAADVVAVRRPGGQWQAIAMPGLAGREIAWLTARPDGGGIALMTAERRADPNEAYRHWRIQLAELDRDKTVRKTLRLPDRFDDPRRSLEDGNVWGFGIGRDGQILVVGIEQYVFCFDTRTGKRLFQTDRLAYGFDSPSFYSADRDALIIGGSRLSKFVLYDLNSGNPTFISARGLNSAGVLPTRNLLWSLDNDGTTRFYDRKSHQRILTSFRLPREGFFTLDTTNRYDTNQGADTGTVRWRLSDRPWETLPPQMFMRERYQPDLLPQRLDCTMAGNCADLLPALPTPRAANRSLPGVRIVSVTAGEPGTARLAIEAWQGRNADNSLSGMTDIRVLRDGRLAQVVATGDAWDVDPDGVVRRMLTLAVPTTGAPVTFTAYAFNGDRRKGETSDPVRFTPPRQDRPRRAFVLNIGIDRYAVPGLNLDFAAADAKALAERLQRIDGFVVRQLLLTSEAGTDAGGQRRPDRARKALLRAAFGLLSGEPGDWAATLAAAGIDTSGFGPATPDDLVIISWSGHGTVGKAYTGEDVQRFALLPSDISQPSPLSDIDEASMVTADDLADWLRPLDAGETVVIIDACHSGASVAANGFKPGPMGDRTLGQLAFDKGIRILAATQADNVAGEEAGRGLGLLTAALIDVGLGGRGPEAEGGWIRLDAVLRLAAASLPERLRAEQQRREAAAPPPLLLPDQWVPSPPVQVPTVFDFTGQASPAWVATQAPPAP